MATDFPLPFIDQLAEYILFTAPDKYAYSRVKDTKERPFSNPSEFREYFNVTKELPINPMLVNKTWYRAFLRQISGATSIAYVDDKSKFEAINGEGAKVSIPRKLLVRIIEADLLRSKEFSILTQHSTKQFDIEQFDIDWFPSHSESILEKHSKWFLPTKNANFSNWWQVFAKMFELEMDTDHLANKSCSAFEQIGICADSSLLDPLFPVYLAFNRKCYHFHFIRKAIGFEPSQLFTMMKPINESFNGDRIEKIVLESLRKSGHQYLESEIQSAKFATQAWVDLVHSLLNNCRNLKEILIDEKINIFHYYSNTEVAKRCALDLVQICATAIMEHVFTSIPLEFAVRIEATFTFLIPFDSVQLISECLKGVAGSSGVELKAKYPFLNYAAVEELELAQKAAPYGGLSRRIKFAQNRHFIYNLVAMRPEPEYAEYDDDYCDHGGGVGDICDYDSDTGVCEY